MYIHDIFSKPLGSHGVRLTLLAFMMMMMALLLTCNEGFDMIIHLRINVLTTERSDNTNTTKRERSEGH